jgi:AcrR family transcriptional regulator
MLYAVNPMPRPRSLTEADIATAALAVIDRDGLVALSMRAVGVELGMGTMSLYRYVTDRNHLEQLVVELVIGGVDATPPARGSWRKKVTTLLERARDAVAAHPEIVPLTMKYRHASPTLVRWPEAVLGVLTDTGFSGRHRVIALRALLSYLTGAIQLEHFGPLSGTGTIALTELPPDEFPLMVETATAARRVAPAEEFRNGLLALLDGLAAMAGVS